MNLSSLDLSGRCALVTGASSGLGAHFARLLAAAGAAVALGARRLPALQRVQTEIERTGATAEAIELDVADGASVRSAVAETSRRLGRVDILVNNAGVSMTRPLLDLDEAEWDTVVDTNLKGSFLVAQEVARTMAKQGTGGSIVNVASILGLRVASQVAPYVASKAGLVRLTEAMALELARYRIRVNCLCPGYIETDLNRDFFALPAGQALLKRIPQWRLGQMHELDVPLLLLCSDAGSYMTGSVLAVDGGHLVNTL